VKLALDWERGHGPVTGPVNAATATLAAAWAGHVIDPAVWPAAAVVGTAGLLGTVVAGRIHRAPRSSRVLRAAAWLGAGGWSCWAITHSPWSLWSLSSLLAGAAGLGVAMTATRHVQAKAEAEAAEAIRVQKRAELDAERAAIADEWEQRIARVCAFDGTRVVGVETWPSGGFSIDGELPEGGHTWKEIRMRAEQLASDARLPEGCGVEVTSGANRGSFLMHVSTENHLTEEVPYPDDYSPLSCNDPAPIGVRRDGTPYGPVNRQASMLIVGQRGSGKTNLMNVKIANQCRMVDSLTFVIDLNGGGLALKWLRAWQAAGRPGKCPIDWVADTPAKALAMAQALVRIAKARKVGYQEREVAADDDKLPVGPDVPEIRVFNDEGAEIFSTRSRRDETLRAIADFLIQTLEIARAAAVNQTTSGLRATQDVLSDPQLLKQSTFKAGMKVADDSELNYFFGYGHGVTTEDAPYPGCALCREGDGQAQPLLIYRMKPSRIMDVVIQTADLHPELDELSRNAAGEAYANRWDDSDYLFGLAPAPTATATLLDTPPEPPAAPRTGGITANWGKPGGTPAPRIEDQISEADDALRHLHERMNETGARDAELGQQFMDIVNGGGLAWTPPPTDDDQDDPTGDGRPDPRYELIYRIVQSTGPDGIGPALIREAFIRMHPEHKAPNATVIGRWLAADPRIHQPKYGRYAVKPE